MGLRSNHYDVAFEEYLRGVRRPYILVDEHRRALLGGVSLKSMDFIVYSGRDRNLLVDVKGRRFPSGGTGRSRRKWENWATRDDLDSLLEWEQVFGRDFRAVLVFAYNVVDRTSLKELQAPFGCRGRQYAFYGVWADEYRRAMRTRSSSWRTVSLPMAVFRRLRLPLAEFL